MALINEHYLKLTAGYLFPEIARRTGAFQEKHPGADVIRMGIGDVVKGIPRVVAEAMKEAVEEMAHDESFQGYPPGEGYDFLIEAIVEHEYASRGVEVAADEVIVSDGSKCDSANIQEIFAIDNTVALTDPVYPVYCDSNVMAGPHRRSRRGRAATPGWSTCRARWRPGFSAAASRPPRRLGVSLLAEQPDGGGDAARGAGGVGRLRPRREGRPLLRRPLTRGTSPTRGFRTRSTRSTGPARSPSRCARSRRAPGSPGCAAPSRSFPKS